MKGQPEAPQPLPEHFHHALRVVLSLEGHHEIIRIAHEVYFTSQAQLDLALESLVQHVVQIDVPEHR